MSEENKKEPGKVFIFVLCAFLIATAIIFSVNSIKMVYLTNTNITTKSYAQNDFNLDIGKDIVAGHESEFKFGRNPAIGTLEEVIWDFGGNYIFLNSAERLRISSNDVNDNGYTNDTGAWNIIVLGLDENFNEINELVTLNGTSDVYTTQSFLRTFRAFVLQSGLPSPVQNTNEGDITIISNVTNTVQAQILQHNGQTLMLVYTVPANKTAYVTGFSANVGEGKACLFRTKFRNCDFANCTFSTKFIIELFESPFFGDLEVPLRVPEKTDIAITGQSTAAGVSASASFGAILIDN